MLETVRGSSLRENFYMDAIATRDGRALTKEVESFMKIFEEIENQL